MADDKKIEKKERTVEDRLKDLYLLQTILSEMDRIKVLRGELPNEVKDLARRKSTNIANSRRMCAITASSISWRRR